MRRLSLNHSEPRIGPLVLIGLIGAVLGIVGIEAIWRHLPACGSSG